MRKSNIIIIKLISVPVIFAGLHFLLNYNRIQIDGLEPEIWSMMHGEDTRYSDDFSHSNFAKIKIGMTEKQVIDLLGEPLTRFSYDSNFDKNTFEKGHFIGLKYSDSPSSANYHLRIVHLDYGVVVRVMGEFYYD